MRVERGLTFADQVWGRLAEAADRRPAAFVAVLVKVSEMCSFKDSRSPACAFAGI